MFVCQGWGAAGEQGLYFPKNVYTDGSYNIGIFVAKKEENFARLYSSCNQISSILSPDAFHHESSNHFRRLWRVTWWRPKQRPELCCRASAGADGEPSTRKWPDQQTGRDRDAVGSHDPNLGRRSVFVGDDQRRVRRLSWREPISICPDLISTVWARMVGKDWVLLVPSPLRGGLVRAEVGSSQGKSEFLVMLILGLVRISFPLALCNQQEKGPLFSPPPPPSFILPSVPD